MHARQHKFLLLTVTKTARFWKFKYSHMDKHFTLILTNHWLH